MYDVISVGKVNTAWDVGFMKMVIMYNNVRVLQCATSFLCTSMAHLQTDSCVAKIVL